MISIVLSGCSHSADPTSNPPKKPEAPPVAGNWTGTATINSTMQYTAVFTESGTFTLSGAWQGANGPAGQDMSGTYTQNGGTLTLNITQNDAIAVGQKTPLSPLTITGTASADGKSIDVGQGLTEYKLTRI